MAILKFKKLIEDLQDNTSQVIPAITKLVAKATSAGYSGTSTLADTATLATSAGKAGSAAYAGTTRIAHYGSSGTGAIAGTHAIFSTGL